LKDQPYTDANRFAVHGWSYGGYMTSSMMMRKPGLFKVGVAGGPVTNWSYYEVMYTERYMDTPQENPDGYTMSNLKNHVGDLQGDLLIIHGSIDDVVVMQHSMDLLTESVNQGVQLDFYTYPMHPHNVRGKDRVHLMKKVLGYIMDRL
jgi:dipeptidyl-peptidase 4